MGAAFAMAVQGAAISRAQEAPVSPEQRRLDLIDLPLEELMQIPVSPFEVRPMEDRKYHVFSSVTASRLNTPIRELPIAVQVFNEVFIRDQKPETIFDVARYSPSVTYRSNDFNEGNANLAIRGFEVGTKPGDIQVFRDGFYGPSIFDFTNVTRLEIVRGPASFLYGQLAPGGVVNIITKTPQPALAAQASLRYGSYNEYRFEGDVTGPIIKGLLFRVASSMERDIQYWKPYDAHSVDFAPALVWSPHSRLKFTLKYEYFGKRETPQVMQKPLYSRQSGVVPTDADPNMSGVEVPGLPGDWNSMSFADFRFSDVSTVELAMDVKATDRWDLRAAYAQQRFAIDSAFSGNLGMSNQFPFAQGRRFRRQRYTNWDTTFEIDAVGRYRLPFMSLRVLAGGQFIASRSDRSAGQAPNDPALPGPIASPFPNWDLRDPSTWNREVTIPLSALNQSQGEFQTMSQDKATYLGTTFGFFDDRLLVLAGGRLTQTVSRTIDRLANTAGHEFVARKYTPQYGVLCKLPHEVSVFASYAESFIPGSQMLETAGVPSTPEVPTLGRGVDVGARADLYDGRLSATLIFFDVRNKNITNQVSLSVDPTTGTQLFSTVQSGERRSRGVELDATLTPVESWQIYLSYSYNDAKVLEYSGNDAAILAAGPSAPGYKEVALLHNAPLQMSAPHLANLWTRYDLVRGPLRGAYVGGGANLVFDQTLLSDTPSQYNQTYALYNVMLGYSAWAPGSPLSLSFELFGKNLANAHYRPSQSTRSRPRELGAMLTVRY